MRNEGTTGSRMVEGSSLVLWCCLGPGPSVEIPFNLCVQASSPNKLKGFGWETTYVWTSVCPRAEPWKRRWALAFASFLLAQALSPGATAQRKLFHLYLTAFLDSKQGHGTHL